MNQLHRSTDPATSKAAASAIEPHLSELQERILAEMAAHGPMTAKECERRELFSALSPSTVRKRISELRGMRKLRETGIVRGRCTEFEVAE